MKLVTHNATVFGSLALAVLLIGAVSKAPSLLSAKIRPGGENSVTMRTYLCREAAKITEGAVHDLTTARAWTKQRPAKLQQYYEMMGIDHLMAKRERPPLNVKVTGVLDREKYRIEKLCFESLPKLYVTGNLYVPKGLTGRAPAVLYVCGHSADQKIRYQPHPRRWAELGFVALVVETIQLGEIAGFHHGCYREGWFNWYSRGYSPAGVELWNGIRAVDLLQSRPEVDPERIGLTGISGGGAMSWWLGAGDERIKVVAPVCGTGTMKSHVAERTVDGHCDCMFHINYYGWDLADVGALIAPRPLMVASANHDGIFSIESIEDCCGRIEKLYKVLGVGDRFRFVETPGPHSYHKISRTEIFSWFMKHLMGREVAPQTIADVDTRDEKKEDLLVFGGKPPADERVTTVHDWFIPKADPPEIADAKSLEAARKRIVAELRNKAFHQFPRKPCALNARVAMLSDGGTSTSRILFTSEEGVELAAQLTVSHAAREQGRTQCLVFLRSPRSQRGDSERVASKVGGTWVRLIVNTRGVWETSWGDDLQWHLRRASAIIGRTIASMRVYDALRALEVARSLPEVDPGKVAIGGEGEMAVVAAYAALLDGKVSGLVLADPPASLDLPSAKDGTGS
ncbi:acetylxylan esterase, partial [Candidatus Sumerlaeota bacterium]|nr:acetylxylan esterase [Candidatus Sumerlaeota bacterium]